MKDKYPIKSELGQGGMATVYLAHDIKFQTNVAIKVLNKEYVHNDNIRKRFIAEARNMFKMSHPNIIKVTDLIDDGDTVAFVMEHIEGETLKEYLDRKGKLSDAEIKNLFSQMLEAVGYVHEQNLVHRDIKPSNFMITKKGQIKLLDFGIAKTTDVKSSEYTQTGTGIQMGTPLYMSPEQVKSSKQVGASSDIYSLGVVLWQMIMCKKPYDSNTLSSPEIQVSILKEPLPLTNTQWDYLIQIATAKPIQNRFKNTAEFLAKLINSSNTEQNTNNIISEKTIAENSAFQSDKNINSTNKPKNFIAKNRKLLIGLIGLIIILIYWYNKNQEEQTIEAPPVEVCLLEPFENVYKLHGYKCNDSIIIAATFTTADNFIGDRAKVSRNDSLFYIDESGKMIEFISSIEETKSDLKDKKRKELEKRNLLEKERSKEKNKENKKLNPKPTKPKNDNISIQKPPKNNLPPANVNQSQIKINANTTKPKNQDDLNPNVDDDFEL
jgi:hypothetical protein